MAKKLGKALIFTAVAGAIAAGGIALYNKYKAGADDFDDDFLDFDDEDEDFDDESDEDDFDYSNKDDKNNKTSSNREYVSIPRDSEKNDDTDYKVNVDVSIDTTGFKDEETDDSDNSSSNTDEEDSELI